MSLFSQGFPDVFWSLVKSGFCNVAVGRCDTSNAGEGFTIAIHGERVTQLVLLRYAAKR